MAGAISASSLLGWYQSFYGGSGTDPNAAANASSSSAAAATPPSITDSILSVQYAPTAPWNENAQPTQNQLVKKALAGANLFNPAAAQLDMPGASADYKNLFALYGGLNTLYAMATEASSKNATSLQISQLSRAFNNGMTQLTKFLGDTSFSKLKLTPGTTQQSQTSSVSTPAQARSYTTPALNTTGDSNAEVPAFEGDVSFTVNVQLGGSAATSVPINLDDMGSTPRTMGNVVNFMNAQLKAAGARGVTFSSVSIAAKPDTIQVGGKTVTIDKGNQSWALKMNTSPAETVTLSAPSIGPAVYVGQVVGAIVGSSTGAPAGRRSPPMRRANCSGQIRRQRLERGLAQQAGARRARPDLDIGPGFGRCLGAIHRRRARRFGLCARPT